MSDAGFKMEANNKNLDAHVFSGCLSLQHSRHYQLDRGNIISQSLRDFEPGFIYSSQK